MDFTSPRISIVLALVPNDPTARLILLSRQPFRLWTLLQSTTDVSRFSIVNSPFLILDLRL